MMSMQLRIQTGRSDDRATPSVIAVVVGFAVGVGATAGSVAAQYGPPDRTEITRFMSRSSMALTDLNNDCAVSDVDIAMMLLDRMTELYGPELAVGDQDGDGVETSEDIVAAIGSLMKGAFGRTAATGGETVGPEDVQQTAIDVTAGSLEGDLNLDGEVNSEDLFVTIDRFGEAVSDWDVDQAARQAVSYMSAIIEHGRDAFMASECAPDTHLVGVSDTWPPDHPGWWQPNHLVSISNGYDGEEPDPFDHMPYTSSHYPTGPHESEISKQWPPNHDWYASSTWDPPEIHTLFTSNYDYPPPHHEKDISESWPPSHMADASSSYPPDHELVNSRTWWPNHTYSDSANAIRPPLHQAYFTQDKWRHETDVSHGMWPPNHTWHMSDGWGGHSTGVSYNYPPGHLSYASSTWPGPQPTWPPMHTRIISESWGDPEDGGLPIFPPDHNWWDTFMDIWDGTDRFPW